MTINKAYIGSKNKVDKFPLAAALSIAVTTFLSITIEMLPAAVMPQMAEEFGVTQSQIGLLMSVWAFTVVATAIPVTLLTAKLGRKTVLNIALVLLIVSLVGAVLSPNYLLVLLSRILGGIAHGMFWSVTGVYAGYIASPKHVAKTVTIIVSGTTMAFILGMPLTTWLAQTLGWEASFIVVIILSILGTILVQINVPQVRDTNKSNGSKEKTKIYQDKTFKSTMFVCLITAIAMIGQYSIYTYMVPFIETQLNFSSKVTPIIQLIYGVAGILGIFLMATVFSKKVKLALIVSLISIIAAISLILYIPNLVFLGIVIFVWGLMFAVVPPAMQTKLIQSSSVEIRDFASASYTTSFNIGIGGGSTLGALLFAGIGLIALPLAAIILLIVALVMAFFMSK